MTGTRGVSPVFAYTLTLAVTTLLIAGLVIAASGYVEGQRESVAENELEVLGQQLSADIAAVDRLSRTETATQASVRRDLPNGVVGSTYTVHIRADGPPPTEYYLEITTARVDATVVVGVASQTDIEPGSVGGGAVVVEYDPATDQLVVSNG